MSYGGSSGPGFGALNNNTIITTLPDLVRYESQLDESKSSLLQLRILEADLRDARREILGQVELVRRRVESWAKMADELLLLVDAAVEEARDG